MTIEAAYGAVGAKQEFSHYIEAGAGHVLSDEMWRRTREFFARHLGVGDSDVGDPGLGHLGGAAATA